MDIYTCTLYVHAHVSYKPGQLVYFKSSCNVMVTLVMVAQVAARVRTEDGEEQWILAEVVSYNSHNHRYVVDDIDEEGHNEKRFVDDINVCGY